MLRIVWWLVWLCSPLLLTFGLIAWAKFWPRRERFVCPDCAHRGLD